VLPAARIIAVEQVPRETGARNRRLEGQRVITDEKFHLIRRQAISGGHHFARQRAGIPNVLIDFGPGEHDVEGQVKRAGVLTADEVGQFPEGCHRSPPFDCGGLAHVMYSIGNIS
jgi:hypothetical protein